MRLSSGVGCPVGSPGSRPSSATSQTDGKSMLRGGTTVDDGPVAAHRTHHAATIDQVVECLLNFGERTADAEQGAPPVTDAHCGVGGIGMFGKVAFDFLCDRIDAFIKLG